MSSSVSLHPDLDSNKSPPLERDVSYDGKAVLFHRLSVAACGRLDQLQGHETIRDDLVR